MKFPKTDFYALFFLAGEFGIVSGILLGIVTSYSSWYKMFISWVIATVILLYEIKIVKWIQKKRKKVRLLY